MPKKSRIHRLFHHFHEAFEALGVQVPLEAQERLAVLVHTTMDGGQRRFHHSGHVLEICEGQAPLQVLAGLFHDLVYYQVDDGFPAVFNEELIPLVRWEGQTPHLTHRQNVERYLGKDLRIFELCREVFGLRYGQELPFTAGFNEFFSALAAALSLRPWLNEWQIVEVVASIEATIPFREESAYSNLESRITKLSGIFELKASYSEVRKLVRGALRLANQDVRGFAAENPADFLDNTWWLILESNSHLQHAGVYTIKSYRTALMRMEGFLCFLDAQHIFHRYDQPEMPILQLRQRAEINLRIARDYIGMKLLGMALLEALAELTGGDAPVAYFMGDVREYDQVERAEDYFEAPPSHPEEAYRPVLLRLLEEGRGQDVGFDMTRSPLTAYIYRFLGDAEARKALVQARRFFQRELSPFSFLASQDPKLVAQIAQACGKLAITRKTRLMQLVTERLAK